MENKFKKLLKVNQVYKSYRQVCEVLGEKSKAGDSKKAQIKEWERYFKYSKDGNKFIIEEIYDAPLPKIENRGGANNVLTTPLSESNPKLASEWMTDKNGMTIPNNVTRRTIDNYWWKCSKCNEEIYTSPVKRTQGIKSCTDEIVKCPYCTLSNHAKFIYKFLKYKNLNFITEYSFDDLLGLGGNLLRFDFAIIEHNKIMSLIEYDGGFHDEELNPIYDSYTTISMHDKLKDEYCIKNNIPLLRIHHSEIHDYLSIIETFINKSLNN